jgi:hypothetical protein
MMWNRQREEKKDLRFETVSIWLLNWYLYYLYLSLFIGLSDSLEFNSLPSSPAKGKIIFFADFFVSHIWVSVDSFYRYYSA